MAVAVEGRRTKAGREVRIYLRRIWEDVSIGGLWRLLPCYCPCCWIQPSFQRGRFYIIKFLLPGEGSGNSGDQARDSRGSSSSSSSSSSSNTPTSLDFQQAISSDTTSSSSSTSTNAEAQDSSNDSTADDTTTKGHTDTANDNSDSNNNTTAMQEQSLLSAALEQAWGSLADPSDNLPQDQSGSDMDISFQQLYDILVMPPEEDGDDDGQENLPEE